MFTLSAGALKPKLQDFAIGGEFPIAVTFDRRKNAEALYLGRTQPLVCAGLRRGAGRGVFGGGRRTLCPRRCDVHRRRRPVDSLMLLRFRYRLVEATEEFAEEIVLAAFGARRQRPALA